MHIAYLTPEYPHPDVARSAGIGSFIKNSATALVARGETVTVFIYGQSREQVTIQDGVTLHFIAQKRYKVGGFFLYRKYLERYIQSIIKTTQIDLLEAPEWTGITAFMKLKVPIILRLHGSDTYFCHLEKRPQKKKNFLFEKRALQRADYIVSVSAFTAQKTKELFQLQKEITIIPNFIATARFTPQERIATELRILNFGSIIRKKGVIALAKAFNKVHKELPEATLHYLGTDVLDAQTARLTSTLITEALTPEARGRVTFCSPVPYEAVQAILKEAAVVALPSYAEAFPMTWLEAMALEKPLVTSNIGWASEMMIDGKTGYCVHPDDTEALAQALLKQLTQVEQATKMGIQARAHLKEHFDEKIIIPRTLTFYNSLIVK